MDLYIRVVDGNFVAGWFQFWNNQISFSMKQYSFHVGLYNILLITYSFFRHCNNIKDFLFRAKLSYSKWVKHDYIQSFLFKYFKRFWLNYKIDEK